MILCYKFVVIPISKIIVLYRCYILTHETIIPTGITWKKISYYMCDSACKWLIDENTQMFRSYG